MLVVTANWEISDGSLWSSAAGGVVARFAAAVARAAVRCGWQADGRYLPIQRVDIVLAGDTFDWIASQAWLGDVRPWHRGHRQAAIHERVQTAALRKGRSILAPLVQTLRRGIPVPRADRRGRPVVGASEVVPVGLAMLAGNLDGGFCTAWPRAVASRLGVAIGDSWSSDRIEVHHGHRLDPLWASPADAAVEGGPTLGALLRIELLARFSLRPAVVALEDRVRRRFLADLTGAHPLAAAAVVGRWLTSLAAPDTVRDAWLGCVEGWHRSTRATGIHLDAPFDVVDALANRLACIARPQPAIPPHRFRLDADPLAEVLLPAPIRPAGGAEAMVVGHLPRFDSAILRGDGGVVCLGPAQADAQGDSSTRGSVHEIGPPTAGGGDPPTVVFRPADAGPCRAMGLGGTVAEWEDHGRTRRLRGGSDAGAWVIEAA